MKSLASLRLGILAPAICVLALTLLPASRAEATATWGLYAPPRHTLGAALFDPVHRRMYLISSEGSDTGFMLWSAALDSAGTWIPMPTSGTPPLTNLGDPVPLNGGVVDPVRNRILVWGGSDTYIIEDTWALSLDTGEWTRLNIGAPPVTTGGARVVYDPDGDRVLSVCGISYSHLGTPTGQNTVWQLNLSGTPTWSQLAIAGTPPIGRGNGSAILDRKRNRILLFGGQYVQNTAYHPLLPLDETWELTLGATPTWRFLPPSGKIPTARYDHFAACDSVGDQMVMQGGNDGTGAYLGSEVWTLSLGDPDSARWTQRFPTGTPPPRPPDAATFDPVRRHLILGGGDVGINVGVQYAEKFRSGGRFELAVDPQFAWSTPFADREFPGIGGPAVLSAFDRMATMATLQGPGTNLVFWLASLQQPPTWFRFGPVGETDPYGSFIADTLRNRLVWFGASSTGLASTWTLSLADGMWQKLTTSGPQPVPRDNSTTLYDAVGDRMILYGGLAFLNSKWTYFGDVWQLKLSDPPTWTRLDTNAPRPPARAYHVAILDRAENRMLIYGGQDTLGQRSDLWSFSLDSLTWRMWSPGGTPPPLPARIAGYDAPRQRMLAAIPKPYPATGWLEYALALSGSPDWTLVQTQGVGPGRQSPLTTGFYDEPRDMLVLYGNPFPTDYTDTRAAQIWTLSPSGTTPVLVSLVEARVEGGVAHLVWSTLGDAASVGIERRIDNGPWQSLAAVVPGADGRLTYDDPGLRPGASYGYRLQIVDGGKVGYAGEVTLTVPGEGLRFAPAANPTTSALRFLVQLPPSAGGARIELYDLSGRRVLERSVPPGTAAPVELAGAGGLRPGVYQARLIVSGRTLASVRVAVLR